jgi:hypothetical protein
LFVLSKKLYGSVCVGLDCEEDLNFAREFFVLCCKRCKTNDLIFGFAYLLKKMSENLSLSKNYLLQ